MLFSDHPIPKPALWLGLLGLIPFFAPALALYSGDGTISSAALTLQFGYAAVILSFLGGVHWGRALAGDHIAPSWPRLLWAVTPSLLGWALLLVPDPKIIAVGFSVAFTLAFIVDQKATKAGMFPPWYGELRKILTTGVLVSFILTLSAGIAAVSG